MFWIYKGKKIFCVGLWGAIFLLDPEYLVYLTPLNYLVLEDSFFLYIGVICDIMGVFHGCGFREFLLFWVGLLKVLGGLLQVLEI